jgi:hypothetical protein
VAPSWRLAISALVHNGLTAKSPIRWTLRFPAMLELPLPVPRAFVCRSRPDSDWEWERIMEQVRLFASAPLAAENRPFDLNWRSGGPWEWPWE